MKRNQILLMLSFVAVVWAYLYVSGVQWAGMWTGTRIAGAAVAAVSLVLSFAARFELGESFSVRARARTLVTTGLYSRIRNPIYVLGEFFLVGLAMLTGKGAFLWGAVAAVPVQLVRARMESRVLGEAFGERYARYKAQTWF